MVAEATSGRALGGEAAEIMARHLSWPMRDQGIASRFEASGATEGEAAGVLALAGFARPGTGPWKGEERVVVLRIDAATWRPRERPISCLRATLPTGLTSSQSFGNNSHDDTRRTDPQRACGRDR
jgi:hypothetical protein